MRSTLAVVAATVVVVVSGWVIDDVIRGNDIPRGVTVDSVSIGGLDRAEATEVLAELDVLDTALELSWEGNSVTGVAADFGVEVDVDATLDRADDRGGLVRPLRWIASLLVDRSVAPVMAVNRGILTDRLASGADGVLVVDEEGPAVSLVEGRFLAAADARLPVVDIDALTTLLLAAVDGTGPTAIALPIAGTETLDRGGAALAADANDLTEGGVRVSLVGDRAVYDVPEAVVREWVRFHDDGFAFDAESVISTLETLLVGVGELGEEASFAVDYVGGIHIIGGAPGSVCCADDTATTLLADMRTRDDPDDPIAVRPKEDPDAKGVAWAESLAITELVGEFTTSFTPGQSRVTNIARIAELTRGAVIEPGETFSVNDYVGRRTVENGFVGAGMISNGVFITSVGGGISQYATTLFNAAFFAGLEFDEYQSHSIYIDRYPYGREATVSFPAPDLQIVNPTPYGVLIWPTTTVDSITVQLYSTQWAVGEQTGQRESQVGVACTRVTTERTRTWVDDNRQETDTVTALYRPEATTCSGASTRPTTTTTGPPTTAPP